MKKLIIAAALLLAAASLVGCKPKNQPAPATPVEASQSAQRTAAPGGQQQEARKTQSVDHTKKHTPAPTANGAADIGSELKKTVLTVKSEDCFAEYGYYFFVAGCDAEYTVEMNDGGVGVEWQVYVLPDKFADAERYISGAYTAALTESGTLQVEKNNYIYVYCSVNTYTSDAPAAGATITFTGVGVPAE